VATLSIFEIVFSCSFHIEPMDVSSTMELPMDGMYPNAQYPEDDYVDDDIENLVRKIVIQRRPRLNYWFKVSASSSVSLCLASLAPTPALPPPGSHHDEPRSHHRTRHHAVRLPTAPQHAMPSSQPLASPLGRPPPSAPRAPPFSSSRPLRPAPSIPHAHLPFSPPAPPHIPHPVATLLSVLTPIAHTTIPRLLPTGFRQAPHRACHEGSVRALAAHVEGKGYCTHPTVLYA
jgi:hypothetical protein